jgi:hypothetical protein
MYNEVDLEGFLDSDDPFLDGCIIAHPEGRGILGLDDNTKLCWSAMPMYLDSSALGYGIGCLTTIDQVGYMHGEDNSFSLAMPPASIGSDSTHRNNEADLDDASVFSDILENGAEDDLFRDGCSTANPERTGTLGFGDNTKMYRSAMSMSLDSSALSDDCGSSPNCFTTMNQVGSMHDEDKNAQDSFSAAMPQAIKKKTPEEIAEDIRKKMKDPFGPTCHLRPKHDIVCARGQVGNKNPANNDLLTKVRKARAEYKCLRNKKQKTVMIKRFKDYVESSGGKFLVRLNKYEPWMEMKDVFAREKISHMFRDPVNSASKARKVSV